MYLCSFYKVFHRNWGTEVENKKKTLSLFVVAQIILGKKYPIKVVEHKIELLYQCNRRNKILQIIIKKKISRRYNAIKAIKAI